LAKRVEKVIMKLKFKKYIYLVNDITNILLKKERIAAEESAKKLRVALIIASILLFLSIIINFYLFLSR